MPNGLVINFYKFIELVDLVAERERLENYCRDLGLLGTILLASEGINGSIFGSPEQIQLLETWLTGDQRYHDLVFKTSEAPGAPFRKLSIKIKPSILAFNAPVDVSVAEIVNGPRVSPEDFRDAVLNPKDDVVIVDTRNKYEIDYGTFRGAKHLGIRSFKNFATEFTREFGNHKDKTYLMYCTGGIRCEKAVAALQKLGFKGAKQLDGGIISYFKEYGGDGYDGDCFVFDDRWAINPDLNAAAVAPHPEQLPRTYDPT